MEDQEVTTDEQEFTYTITDSSTASDSTDISIEDGASVTTGYNSVVTKAEIEVSFKKNQLVTAIVQLKKLLKKRK